MDLDKLNNDTSYDEEDDIANLRKDQEEGKESIDSSNASHIGVKKTKGRPKIPEQWSRVISIRNDDLSKLRVFELGPDLLLADAMKYVPTRGKQLQEIDPIFFPDHYVKEGHSMKIQDNIMGRSTLEKFGKKVTKYRKTLRDRALEVSKQFTKEEAEFYLKNTKALERRMHKGYFKAPKEFNACKLQNRQIKTLAGHQSIDDKINMIYDIIIGKYKYKEAAKKYRQKISYVGNVMNKLKKNKEMINEIIEKRDILSAQEQIVKDTVQKILNNRQLIQTVQQVIDEIEKCSDEKLSYSFVKRQMLSMGLKYKKIKNISWQGNSEKSLVLRQQFAIKFLEIDHKNVIIINVDETWLGMLDYRRMLWKPEDNYSIGLKQLVPRISMIVGVDSHANVYMCLTQSNSNKSMMSLFMEELVKKLDKQSPHWRNFTIIQWDGAAYHKAQGTQEMLKRLRIPIIMNGPYSYDASSAELFFAEFKKDDINPNKIKLGKSHFKEIVELCVQRCLQIPKQHLILNWHHTLLCAYKYLNFYRI